MATTSKVSAQICSQSLIRLTTEYTIIRESSGAVAASLSKSLDVLEQPVPWEKWVSCAVYKQGRALKPRKTAQHHAWRFDDGSYIEIIWELYKPGLGNTIEIETGANKVECLSKPKHQVSRGSGQS